MKQPGGLKTMMRHHRVGCSQSYTVKLMDERRRQLTVA